MKKPAPLTLTIAGLDPSGGAGVIADIKTFLAFECDPAAAITSITFQNSARVLGAVHQSAEALRSQVLPLADGQEIAAVKIGMLPTVEIVREVVWLIHKMTLPAPVVDPVITSTSGWKLMEDAAVQPFVRELMPLARVITPNIPEAERLSGLKIVDQEGMCAAAGKLREMGARAVLVKGGHLKGGTSAIDVLNDQGHLTILREEWIDAPNVHGSGCMLSSAIAASLAKGLRLQEAVIAAKSFVADVIRRR